jgi:nitroreductase
MWRSTPTMELLKAILGRRSVRRYTDQEVEREKLKELVKAATWAPTAGKMQSWRFFVLKDPSLKELVRRACRNQMFVEDASHLVVACFDRDVAYRAYGMRGVELYAVQETAAAVQNLMLRAEELGLGTCWVGAFDAKDIQKALELPDRIKPVTVVTVGYPDESPQSERKDLKEVAKFVERTEE